MKNRIMVGFKNDRAMINENIISDRIYPVTNTFSDSKHTYTIINLQDKEEFSAYITDLAKYIIRKYENKILKKIIKDSNFDMPYCIINEIINLKDDEDFDVRLKMVEKSLKNYFFDNEVGNIEGMVTFRLTEYKKYLSILAENLVEKYYVNREYQDFIELLRYFINVQNYRPELIYIDVSPDGTYKIFNENDVDITHQAMLEIATSDEIQKLAHDDLLISILISIAPKKITIRNKENIKNKELFETIGKVFEKISYIK